MWHDAGDHAQRSNNRLSAVQFLQSAMPAVYTGTGGNRNRHLPEEIADLLFVHILQLAKQKAYDKLNNEA